MFGNSVLRSYTKNLPIRQFRVTQLRKELADSAILCYAKNLPMMSTISLVLGHDGLQGLVGSDAGQNLTFQMELFFFRRIQMH